MKWSLFTQIVMLIISVVMKNFLVNFCIIKNKIICRLTYFLSNYMQANYFKMFCTLFFGKKKKKKKSMDQHGWSPAKPTYRCCRNKTSHLQNGNFTGEGKNLLYFQCESIEPDIFPSHFGPFILVRSPWNFRTMKRARDIFQLSQKLKNDKNYEVDRKSVV